MFINEAFNSSVGTQRSDLGKFKLFCLDITTLTVPNLVVNDLFLVKPMASFTGYLTYLQFSLANVGTDKEGGIIMNESPFTYAPMTEKRERYTSDRIVEAITDTSAAMALAWSPVVTGAFDDNGTAKDVKIIAADGTVTYANLDSDGKVPAASLVANGKVAYMYDNIVIPQEKLPSIKAEMKGITLEARARRIAVTYSQIAAFQA